MTNNKIVSWLSIGLVVFAYLFAAVAIPFIIFAGIGLLIAAPFVFFAFKEWEEVVPLLRKNKPLKKSLRRKRSLRVLACGAGMTIVLGLIWWSNLNHPTSNPVVSFTHNILWAALISFLLVSPQLLYRKK